MRYIVIVGTLFGNKTVHGPFNSKEWAEVWGKNQTSGQQFEVVQLKEVASKVRYFNCSGNQWRVTCCGKLEWGPTIGERTDIWTESSFGSLDQLKLAFPGLKETDNRPW